MIRPYDRIVIEHKARVGSERQLRKLGISKLVKPSQVVKIPEFKAVFIPECRLVESFVIIIEPDFYRFDDLRNVKVRGLRRVIGIYRVRRKRNKGGSDKKLRKRSFTKLQYRSLPSRISDRYIII